MKLKVMTIVGTRPEIIRLSLTIKKLDKYFKHILVNTKQNNDSHLNDVFFEELKIRKPDFTLNVLAENTGKTISNIIDQTFELMSKTKPDCVLILGDTNSSLSAISAKKLKIPVFHMEAGNRSFDENLPEEINRRIVDEISDINLPYTERARLNLIEAGQKSETIFKTGSPLFEVLKFYRDKINESNILSKLKINNYDYILVSIHRNENISSKEKLSLLIQNISAASAYFKKQIIFSMHPATLAKIKQYKISIPKNFLFSNPFSFFEYIYMQMNAFCVISDSGSLAEESTILNFPAVSLRSSTERQEALEISNFTLANLDKNSLINSISFKTNSIGEPNTINPNNDYFNENVSDKIVNIIQSYAPILLLKIHKQ